jgi:hypothetical protein
MLVDPTFYSFTMFWACKLLPFRSLFYLSRGSGGIANIYWLIYSLVGERLGRNNDANLPHP